MTKLLEIKDKIINFFGMYESYLMPAVKFFVSFAVFLTVNSNIGYMQKINTVSVAALLALCCCLLPTGASVVVATVLILLHMYALSLETALVSLILVLFVYLIYFRFTPQEDLLVLLTPVCFQWNIPYIMPLASGLLGKGTSVSGVVVSSVLYYFLDGVHRNEVAIRAAQEESTGEVASIFQIVIGQLLYNYELYLVIGIFVLTSLVVQGVKRLPVEHSWTLAILLGTLIEGAGLFVGYMVLKIPDKTILLLVGDLASILIAFVLQFFCMNLDYARTERVQFEDDEYYYYVKAVPKKMVASEVPTVKYFGNTSNMGKGIDRRGVELSEEQEKISRKVIARELDIDENLFD